MNYPQNKEEIVIHITTRREGLLTKIGHDLRLEVKPNTFTVDGESFSGSVDVSKIEILGAVVGSEIESMSSGDKSKIMKTMQKTVLDAKRHPMVNFSGTFGSQINLELEIRGKKGSIALDHDSGTWTGTLDHRDYGISQVKALLGSLKVNPDLEIAVTSKT